MAFRQPTFHAPLRVYPNVEATSSAEAVVSPHPLEESQEWILFSPGAASTTDRTYTGSSAQTRTAGRSRISDFGSLDTATRSYDDSERHTEGAIEEEDEDEGEAEEDGELDSLDSHLLEFRTEPSVYHDINQESGTVLPTHDGLGSFRVDQTAMGPDVQDHLYAFERFNPRRVKRRRESLEMGMPELESERAAEAERMRRIELWRMEQSRALADEIQRETRRRNKSMSSTKGSRAEERDQEDVATLSNMESSGMEEEEKIPAVENETFWNRITRRVIRDLMGIDDDLLSILFGEALPEDDDLSTTPPAFRSFDARGNLTTTSHQDRSSWEYRLFERIARELGILANQISDHPAAFSTYLNSQQIPLPYAGLSVIPESARDIQLSKILTAHDLNSTLAPSEMPQFLPTLPTQTHPPDQEQEQTTQRLPIPIPTTSTSFHPLSHSHDDLARTPTPITPLISRSEWERDLDLKIVFQYLRSRFTSKLRSLSPLARLSPSKSPPLPFSPADLTTSPRPNPPSPAELHARAARVRMYHPLVPSSSILPTSSASYRPSSRDKDRHRSPLDRRTWRATVPGGNPLGVVSTSGIIAGGVGVAHVRRGSSSCASERARRVRNANGSGSSRHYWDWGATPGQGSGSGVSVGGGAPMGMGSWGEV